MINRKRMISAIVAIFVLISVLTLPMVPALCIQRVDTGQLLGAFYVPRGDEFYVEFKHSVNRTPVREYYRMENGKTVLSRAEYVSFGAGMPEVPEQKGSVLRTEDGVLRLDDINQPLDSFIYRIGIYAGHTLVVKGRVLPLKTIAPVQTALRFSCQRVSVYALLRRYKTIE